VTPRVRALLGAAGGALLVLVAHPSTRPGLLAAFRKRPPDDLSGLLTPPPLRKPTDRPSGAAYLHEGAERLVEGSPLTQTERKALVEIAERGADTEVDNAFWPLARSVFETGAAARGSWRTASRRLRYDDYQNEALTEMMVRAARQVQGARTIGDAPAWIYAAAAPRRSLAMGAALKSEAFRTLETLDSPRVRDEYALQTIHNGATLRNYSRQYRLAAYGMAIVEGATYPPGAVIDDPATGLNGSPRRLVLAKGELTRKLRESGRGSEARFCDRQFQVNDSWQAFQEVRDPAGRFQALALAAVFVAALPGGFLVTALVGGLVWMFGRRTTAVAYVRSRFHGSGLAATSFALLGGGVFLGYPWVGLTAAACALVPALGPERPKRFGDATLGPLHGFLVGVVTLVLLIGVPLAAVARSLPGALLPELGPVGAWLGDAQRLGALIVALLGASALIAPAYAVVRRFSTPTMAAQTYARVGRNVTLVALALALVASPLCYALDRLLGNALLQITLNEPRAYGPTDVGAG